MHETETGSAPRPDDGDLREELMETLRSCLPHAGPMEGSTSITDLIHDSIDLVELISVVSERWAIRFDLFEMDDVRTVDDLVAYVERRQGTAGDATDPLDRL